MNHFLPFSPADPRPMHDFMSGGVVRHATSFPWYNVTVRIEGNEANCFMVPSLSHLKKILAQQSDHLTVEAIEYVTPGYMNGSDHWKMEPLIEVTELFNSYGWSIPRCRVLNDRVYRGISIEPMNEWTVEQHVYSVQPRTRGA